MQCFKCLFINQPGAHHCAHCGAQLSASLPMQGPPVNNNALLMVAGGVFLFIVVVGILIGITQSAGERRTRVAALPPTAPAPSSASASDAPAPANQAAERLQTAKHFLENDRSLGALYTARSELTKIQPSDGEYAEAQKMLKQIEPEIAKEEKKREAADKARAAAEAPAERERLADDYLNVISAANPHLNFIKKRLGKTKGGYALWLVHEFFTSSTFSIGDDAKLVQAWIAQNHGDLLRAGIVRVGFMNSSGYLGSCYFDLK